MLRYERIWFITFMFLESQLILKFLMSTEYVPMYYHLPPGIIFELGSYLIPSQRVASLKHAHSDNQVQ